MRVYGSPKNLLLADTCGALLSVVFLMVLFPRLPEWIGLPVNFLKLLGSFALLMSIHSFYRYYFYPLQAVEALRSVAGVNTLYLLLTVIILWSWHESLMVLDYVYFISEAVIVIGLIIAEWKASVSVSGGHI